MSAKMFIPLLVFLLVEDPWANAQDGRIKLCGREFVRRVISSCGSSRGKRHAPEIDRPHWGVYSDLLERLRSDQFSGSEEGQEQQLLPQKGPVGHAAHDTPAQDAGSPEGRRTQRSRLRRDMGPAGLCCRSGCTESELVQFC